MRRLIVILISLIAVSGQEIAQGEIKNKTHTITGEQIIDIKGFLKEYSEYVKAIDDPKKRIDEIIKKYIPKGVPKKAVLEALKNEGFIVGEIKNRKYFNPSNKLIWDEGYSANMDITPLHLKLFLIKKEIKLSLRFNNGILGAVGGEIKTTGP